MLVLGIVVLAFLGVHLIQFWAKMQLQELISHDLTALPVVGEAPAAPALGTLFLQLAFESWWTPVVYIIGFVALWFHMNHGFWSMFHTVGWDNNIWIERLKKISCWWTSIVVALFIAQAVVFTLQAHNKFFLTDTALQEQYAEAWSNRAEALIEDFQAKAGALDPADMDAQLTFFAEEGVKYADQADAILEYAGKQAPQVSTQQLATLKQFAPYIRNQAERAKSMKSTNSDNNQ